ncbi:MAG: chromosome segregation protein SMC [Myxococcaceae bacterium]|nr:chromosome segregation protein SMC [Myxococcaceae bacterium]
MRIKRLDITGFKSFMDRSVFSFDNGITGVVGPNGCGKSNVVDAIRWVMGEQSAKNLRGRGMEDVIFNGSEAHAPLSMAEVTLTFAIEAGDSMPETMKGLPEVSVTRRLFRNGDSEYQLNKTNCRLLDITELFLGTGVGTRAYSIIEQGRVGQIVSARPEDRRSFIEEAAGVTKYKARRKAAERKMEHTEGNLLRVKDLVGELERRLESLERQAKKAEKYKKLKGELLGVELHVLSHRYLELLALQKVQAAKLSSLSDEERAGVEAVSALEAAIGAARAQYEAQSAELEALQTQLHALESEAALAAQELEHARADQRSAQQRAAQAKEELVRLEERAQALTAEQLKQREVLAASEVANREDEVQLQVLEEEQRRAVHLLEEVQKRLAGERADVVGVVQKVANLETKLEELRSRFAELDARRARLNGEISTLREEEAQLEAQRAQVLDRVGSSRQLAQEFAARRGEEEAQLNRTRDEFAENEIQVICLREELADKRSRLHSLLELQKHYEGFDRGVRAVMRRAGEDPRALGIFGLVADVISAPKEHERAIEAALGERLQHVVVESQARGLELVAHLKELAEGRSTFVPVSTELGAELTPPEGEGLLALARDVVLTTEPILSPLVRRLLDGVALAADAATAQALAERNAAWTFVTPEGDLFAPHGAVTGGVLEGATVGALQKKREIEELQNEVAQVEARYNEIVTRHYELQKRMGHVEGVLKGLAKNQHAEELNLTTHEKDLAQAGQSLSKLRERLDVLGRDERELADAHEGLEREEHQLKDELIHAQLDRQAREERMSLLGGETETLEARTRSLGTSQTELKVRVAAVIEKRTAAEQALAQAEVQWTTLEDARQRAEGAKVDGEAAEASLAARIEEIDAQGAGRTEKIADLRSQLEGQRASHHHAAEAIKSQDQELRLRREAVDELAQGLSELALHERELALELGHVTQDCQDRFSRPISEAVHEFHQQAPPTAESKERLKDLRAQIERMGEVNVTAIEEHAQLSERYTFLSGQQKDLEDSLARLHEAIKKIDQTSRERFQQTFTAVAERFEAIFPRLFGGGRAQLVLTQEGPGQEQGVEIIAQPPGKKLQSVGLLSGGEKALTAVSMIFAIFLIKPTPFCLLDEVDAPLDEGNVGRYNDMVREMSKQSQFILITHNKRTMEIVDTLYGVTMEEPGVSKLVNVRMKDAAAANQNAVA